MVRGKTDFEHVVLCKNLEGIENSDFDSQAWSMNHDLYCVNLLLCGGYFLL